MHKITENSQENKFANNEDFNLNLNLHNDQESISNISEERKYDSNSTNNNEFYRKKSNKFYIKRKMICEKEKRNFQRNKPNILRNNNSKHFKRLHSRKFIRFYSLLNKEKKDMDKLFIYNIHKILNFFNEIGIDFKKYKLGEQNNPLLLLKSLIEKENIKSRNLIINKVESNLSKLLIYDKLNI